MNRIYESGCIPPTNECIFIPIPEKGDLLNCSNYRLINLMKHMAKILIHIILLRVKKVIHTEVSWEQFGFRKNKGTRNATFVIRSITEIDLEMQQDVYIAFIHYEKAVDRVMHIDRVKDLEEMGTDGKDIRVLQNLCL